MTTLNYDGNEIGLAKFTIAEQAIVEGIDAETDARSKAKAMYEFLDSVIGERFSGIVNGHDYETCDLTIMSDLYFAVTDAYGQDMHKTENMKAEEQMRKVDSMRKDVVMFNKAIENATKNVPHA